MKVLQVMAGAETGGAENIFLESVTALAEAGVDQMVVTRDNNAFRLRSFAEHGIPVETASFSTWWRLPTQRTIARAIRQYRPDVIEYWMGRAGTFAPAECRERNIGWYGGYYKLERFANCDWHVGLTKDLVRHIREQGVADANIGLVHTYADFPYAEPTPRALLDTPEDAPLVLALARLHWKKGLDTLLNAMAKVPGAYVWIAGDGPLRDELETQARLLKIEDRVRLLGWRDDRGSLLAACDMVAFPSRYEPFGTVTVDAWAAGRPLIAAASQGPKAYVHNEENGLLIGIDDVDALATAMNRVINEPALRERIVAGGKATYHQQFTKAAFVRDCTAFYETVASAAPALTVS